MAELIITEKPSAAKKMADALADTKPSKESINAVPVYRLKHGGKDIIVACAVGHLYTVSEKEKSSWSKFPVYDVEWVPTSNVDKKADFSKKYLTVIKKLAKEADSFTVACDYDIEGEVIGLNIILNACKKKDASRMKFSTLTKPDLLKSYDNKSKSLDWGQANAGVTRHILDFYYGINLTRALTAAINNTTGRFKVLSSGRVQGPALKIIVDREKEIKAFVPVPYWQVELEGHIKDAKLTAMHETEKFWDKAEADKVMDKVKGAKQGKIADNQKKNFNQAPPTPFDLTTLQVEAHRCFKIKPKHTLDIAQKLYTEGYISYPRTSSQKLPEVLGLKNLVTQLKRQKTYEALADKILKTPLKPNEGSKTDDAHPSIYPTGIAPENIDGQDLKLYDLIVKRFLSVFAEPAVRETNTLKIDVNEEIFVTKGTVTLVKGWHEFYAPYVKLDEIELPAVKVGDIVDIDKITEHAKETKPPKRYTQSSIIKELEKKNLGTKATRATVVETLFDRGYVVGDNNIEATELGIKTCDTLAAHCPAILDEDLTREFEEEMELIRKKEKTGEQILQRAKKVLDEIIDRFKQDQKVIGMELAEANNDAVRAATTIGLCPNCKEGELVIRSGKFGPFIGCNNYPDCKTIFNVPRSAAIKPTGKSCDACGKPTFEAKLAKSAPKIFCVDPECPSRKTEEAAAGSYPEEGMTCPNCKEGKMVLRKSFYGEFLGCDAYPKCKTMMRIVDGKVDTVPLSNTNSKKAPAKKGAKKAASK